MTVSGLELKHIKRQLKDNLLFGYDPSWELFAILTVYFVQGILGLARLAVSFFLKDDLSLSPAQVGALMGVAAIPWMLKPFLGFLSDGLPILGYKRRSYLILSGLLGSLSWVALGTIVNNAQTATLILLIISLSVALSDVIVDSVVVERSRKETLSKAGSLQSLTWGISSLGGLITAYLSGFLLEYFTNQTVFLITAIFPLIVTLVAVLIVESPVTKDSSEKVSNSVVPEVKGHFKEIWQTFKQKSILFPTIFVFLWQATPSADSAFFFFTTNELGFEAEFLGRVRLVTSLAAMVGIFIYQKHLKTVSFPKILGWSIVLSTLLGLTSLILITHTNRTLGIDDHWFSLGDNLILTLMGQIAFMPVLVLSARLCPSGIEATFFALLMSIWNLSGLLSHELGALLTHLFGVTETNFDRLWLLVLVTNLSSLLPLPLIGWLPKGDPQKLASQGQKEATLPPSEVYEHHPSGSPVEDNFLPDVAPEFVTLSSSQVSFDE
ncbi:MAG: folate/biopterin family MFS transporter [Microcystaceae cyanobacterium]